MEIPAPASTAPFTRNPAESAAPAVPWRPRIGAKTGIQGTLALSFMLMLATALAASCWMFAAESRDVLGKMERRQAVDMSTTLGIAAQSPLANRDAAELARIGRDLLNDREIVAVAFFDAGGHLLSFASQDAANREAATRIFPNPKLNPERLMQVFRGTVPAYGPYVQVTAPVFVRQPSPRGHSSRLTGYTGVCISQAINQAGVQHAQLTLVLAAAAAMLIGLPVAYLMAYRGLQPIRSLVDATNRIAAGDFNAEVAIDRPDAIGTLARSFNQMVRRIRDHQQALADANRDLEDKVRLRTEQLEAANRRLQSEVAEKEDFLRAVSHDLGAPLRNIGGMAEMLLLKRRETLDDEIVHRLERIQKNVEIETGLISELLELSRIKTRRQRMEMVETEALVRELGGLFEGDLTSRGIRLLVDTPLPVLLCERARLRQVFQNLIDNAVKYMGEGAMHDGRPVREIHVGCLLKRGEAEFYVRDTGIGIDPEDADKVFYVFRRGKNAATQKVAGKGVGLASVKSIVETYSGQIWVQSQPGEGSTFRFTINGQYVPSAASGSGPAAATQLERSGGSEDE